MIQQSYDRSTKFRIVEVGDEGWAEFKKPEADQRDACSESEEARRVPDQQLTSTESRKTGPQHSPSA